MIQTDQAAATRWELTAPESIVLRDGTRAKPAEVLKVAVLELVTRRVLRLIEVERRDWRGRLRSETVIGAGARPAPLDGPLAPIASIALEATARTYPDGTVGLSIPAFAHAFKVQHRNIPGLYIQQTVLPALEARGLFASQRRTWLGRFGATTIWTRTPEGDRVLERLDELTSIAERDAAEWDERDPQRLAAFLAAAGSAALLVPSAFPVFEAFTSRLRNDGDGGEIAPILTASTIAPDDSWPTDGIADLGGIDLSGLSLDFSAFAGLDGALSGMDAGLGAGMAGADGGGAGGDGGGGGGT